MLSAKYPKYGVDPQTAIVNIEINMFWDGMFHAFTWLMTCLGLYLLWNAVKRDDVPQSGLTLVGSLFLGWGSFNLVEGIIDHHILHIHHVTETHNHLIFDFIFLASGTIMVLLGIAMIHNARKGMESLSTELSNKGYP